MNEVISVIIPVYNVAQYLPQCLESVISQNYDKLEIILVDDGSTDQSGKICDLYAEQDKSIIVVHQSNGGSAAAKNHALEIASGMYLAFLDADDYLEPNSYSRMISYMNHYAADVVQGNFRYVYTNGTEEKKPLFQFKEFDTEEYLKEYTTDWTCALLWDKLYKRSLFTNIFFEEGHVVDDEFFTYQGIMNAKKIIQVSDFVYNYRKRKSSVTSIEAYQSRIINDKLSYLESRRKAVSRKFPSLQKYYEIHYLNMILLLTREPYLTEDNILLIKEKINSFFKEKRKNERISIQLLFSIKKIQYSSIKSLLRKRNLVKPVGEIQTNYFE